MKISKRLKASELAVASDVVEMCETAKQMEDSGDYADAARSMGKWWRGIGVKPDVEDLPADKKAAVLSRIGALSGWLGSMQQVPDSQEKAKDLISEGANLFETIHDWNNWAEARSDLAVCYWREGAFNEARDFLYDTMADFKDINPVIKGKLLLRLVNIEISSHQYSDALAALKKATPLVEEHGNDLLLGKLYFHRALINRRKAEETNSRELLTSVINDYSLASNHYQKASHQRYSAMVENNLGYLYLYTQNFDRAHIHLDKALKMYSELKDKGHAALVYDNKARAFIAQDNLPDAELAALTSVNLLREGGENAALAESLTTLAIVLNRGGNTDKAIDTFTEAKETALVVGDKESAGSAVLAYIEELQTELTPVVFRKLFLEANELLKDSPKKSNIDRLLRIARKHFESGNPESLLKKEKYFAWKNFSFQEAILSYEKELIRKALNESAGRITKAAGLLGMSHQSLSQILHQRHKDLQKHAIQRRPRGGAKIKKAFGKSH